MKGGYNRQDIVTSWPGEMEMVNLASKQLVASMGASMTGQELRLLYVLNPAATTYK